MIDEKTLAKWEQDAIDAGLRGYAEAFRNARRYLALREIPGTLASEVRRLREENERQHFDILAMNQSLDLLRDENNSLHEKHVRLHKEIVRLSGHLNKLDIEHKWSVGEAKRLTEENERLRKDLEQESHRLEWALETGIGFGDLVFDKLARGEDPRQAIDAARGAK